MPTKTLIDRLMAVKPDDLSPNAWAIRAGVSRTVFNDIRKRNNVRHDTLEKLLGAVEVSLAAFEGGPDSVRTEVAAGGVGLRDLDRAWRGAERRPPVPLVGAAVGGEWDAGGAGDAVELVELRLGDVLEYLARPPSLFNDLDAYAITTVGDSMAPRFEPGERAYVSPRASVGIGDDAIVQLRGDGREDEADRITMVLIKRIVKIGPREIVLRQFNPPIDFAVPRDRVAAIHKVMGRL